MIKSLKLFTACVQSLRTAEKEYEKDPTAFNKNIVVNMQKKVDVWIKWVHDHDDAELARKTPPFIGKTPSSGYEGVINNDIMQQLLKIHTPEEIEAFTKRMRSETNHSVAADAAD